MTDTKRSMIIDVQEDENGELFLQFPDDLMEQLGWKEGDTINWDIDETTGHITVRKVEAEGPQGP
jgi:antitoxin component of MazEF toxin-antitoxin module